MKKKTSVSIQLFLLSFFIILIAAGCKKDGNPNNSATPLPTTFTDIEGNVYQTVKIGSQVWMAENLKVTRYRNGDTIPNVTNDTQWSNLTTGAYCNYFNDTNYAKIYGKLYNCYVISDPRNICPIGWHIPSFTEWEILSNFLGGDSIAGGKLKETGILHWNNPNIGASNESGFTALPAGFRTNLGDDITMGYYSLFWSSTEDNTNQFNLNYEIVNDTTIVRSFYNDKKMGFSIRCVKD